MLPASLLTALGSQITWSAWVLVSRQRALGSQATPYDFGPLCGIFHMLFVDTEKCQRHIFGIESSKHRHLETLANAPCKPQNAGLPHAHLLQSKLPGLGEFLLCSTSRASCGQTDGMDAAGALPPFPGTKWSQEGQV